MIKYKLMFRPNSYQCIIYDPRGDQLFKGKIEFRDDFLRVMDMLELERS